MKSLSVTVMGAGKIGRIVAYLLNKSGDYNVLVADTNPAAVHAAESEGIRAIHLEAGDHFPIALDGAEAVVNCLPYHAALPVAEYAVGRDIHYFDLTEDIQVAERLAALGANARSVVMTQSGLAPGAIAVIASDMYRRFERIDRLDLRVGALPRFPTNALKYALTWSTAGLVRECIQPVRALANGEPVTLPPLTERETFHLDGIDYECFTTSGGLGSMWQTYRGKVGSLLYRTIRYPGHCDLFRFMAYELGLAKNPELFEKILDESIPTTTQDVVVIVVTARGLKEGRLTEESFVRRISDQDFMGKHLTAIQLTTACGVCTMVDLLREGKLPKRGFVRQEDVALSDFLANRFGAVYA